MDQRQRLKEWPELNLDRLEDAGAAPNDGLLGDKRCAADQRWQAADLFFSSPEGQALCRDADYIPVDPAVTPKDLSLRPDGGTFHAIYMAPKQVDSDMPQ